MPTSRFPLAATACLALLAAAPGAAATRFHRAPLVDVDYAGAPDQLDRESTLAKLKPLLERYDTSLSEELPRLFQMQWTGLPVRVDIVDSAGFGGANSASTDSSIPHIRISSTNSGNQDRAALEVADMHHEREGLLVHRRHHRVPTL